MAASRCITAVVCEAAQAYGMGWGAPAVAGHARARRASFAPAASLLPVKPARRARCALCGPHARSDLQGAGWSN